MRTPLLIAAAVALIACLSACSPAGNASPQLGATTTTTAAPTTTTTTTTAAAATTAAATGPACTADQITVAGGFGADPKITIPKGCAPARTLLSKDLVAGSGPGVKDGGTVVVNYQVVTWSDSHVQDSSFTSGTPFPLENVGHAGVIQGWNQGLIGIQKGARRLLIVPPSLGYPNGRGTIKPGETLVFVIDAVSVA